MSEPPPRNPTERLLDELWPCPPAPPGLARRVLAALRDDGPAVRPPVGPPDRPQRRRGRLVVASLVTASLAALVLVVAVRRRGSHDADGQVVAERRQTVSIGARGAAALEPGADLTWSTRGKQTRVQQRRGAAFYRVEHGGPFLVSTPAGDVEVTGTCFRVSVSPIGPAPFALVSVLEGAVEVHGGQGRLSLTAGQTARLAPRRRPELTAPDEPGSMDELRARASRAEARLRELEDLLAQPPKEDAPPQRAALVLPWSSLLTVYGDALEKVSLSLPPGPRDGAVEVARDRAFEHKIFSGAVTGPFVTVPSPRQGDLYWRVAGAAAPAHARFLPEPRDSSPSPHNVVSDSRDSTTIYTQGAPPEITLTFAAAASSRYQVRVYRDGALDRPIFTRAVTTSRCSIPAGALPDGRYVWSAQPLGAAGDGRFRKLEIVYDKPQSSGLAIRFPRPGDAPRGRALDVGGLAPVGARLFVNGRAAVVDGQGHFSLRLAAPPRLLVFRLLARSGGESYWIRRLPPRS